MNCYSQYGWVFPVSGLIALVVCLVIRYWMDHG